MSHSSPASEFLWYLPNTVEPGHRGDTATVDDGYGSLDYQVDLATAGRGPRLGRCAARHQLGPAGHLHRGHRPSRPAPRRSTR